MVSDLKAVLFVTSRSIENEVWAGGRVEFEAAHTINDIVLKTVHFFRTTK